MRKAFVFILMTLFASIGVAAQQGEYDDVAKKIEDKINSEDKVQIDHLKVLHNNGTIYLEGVAKQFGSKYMAGKIAEELKGISKVDNQIAVSSSQVSDDEIQANLIGAIRRHIRDDQPFDTISVKTTGGFVTLYGTVRDATLVDKAFKDAIWVRGVRGVENKIELTPLSASDDRLRIAIFRRLQAQHPRYFAGRPSILILVNNGRVTLQGAVGTEVEKVQIGSSIRSINGVISVDNQLNVQ
jgi:osmotically-inducible protein OsmY